MKLYLWSTFTVFSGKLKRNNLYFFDLIFLKDLFYIDENNFFTTHDWVVKKEEDGYVFYVKTTYFNRKVNFKEEDFDDLIKSSKDLKMKFVYDSINKNEYNFKKCF